VTVFTTERTARKPHTCDVCDGPIERGQRYESHVATPRDPDIGNKKWARCATHLKNCYGSRGERQ
jgi:hypothetical protein